MSSVSSSSVLVLVVSLSRTCCLVVCCWLGCRSRGDRGRGSCWLCESVAHEKSLSMASHSELSSVVVSQVMSLVRSLLPLLDLSGCKLVLKSSSAGSCYQFVSLRA